MKLIYIFFVLLFGVFLSYARQHYHHALLVGELKQEIGENQQRIDEMRLNILSLSDELEREQIVQKIILCESGYKHNVRGDGGKALGPAQFHKETFRWMKAQAGRTDMQWQNPEHQLWLLKWALKAGYGNHWTCYRQMNKGM